MERIFQKDYHFSSKLLKTVKTSPCFKFVGILLIYTCICLLYSVWTRGRHGRSSLTKKLYHFSLFSSLIREKLFYIRIYRKIIPNDYHLHLYLQNYRKLSEFVVLSHNCMTVWNFVYEQILVENIFIFYNLYRFKLHKTFLFSSYLIININKNCYMFMIMSHSKYVKIHVCYSDIKQLC